MDLIIFDFSGTLYNTKKKEFIDNAPSVLEKLSKKTKLALIGKGNEERRELIKNLGIEHFFADIFIKPDKTAGDFLSLIGRLKLKPEKVLVVGDRVKVEIKIGNKIGAKTVWLKKGTFANEIPSEEVEKPDYVISNLEEILEIID